MCCQQTFDQTTKFLVTLHILMFHLPSRLSKIRRFSATKASIGSFQDGEFTNWTIMSTSQALSSSAMSSKLVVVLLGRVVSLFFSVFLVNWARCCVTIPFSHVSGFQSWQKFHKWLVHNSLHSLYQLDLISLLRDFYQPNSDLPWGGIATAFASLALFDQNHTLSSTNWRKVHPSYIKWLSHTIICTVLHKGNANEGSRNTLHNSLCHLETWVSCQKHCSLWPTDRFIPLSYCWWKKSCTTWDA